MKHPRQIALLKGEKYYFTGNPCKRGHFSKRLVSTSQCYECVLPQAKLWKQENKEYCDEYRFEWYLNNKELHSKRCGKYQKIRRKNDPEFKLLQSLRTRLNRAIKGNFKVGSAVIDLGCSISELKTHLESQFQPGMAWGNWSRTGWHIDHIKPLASFDLTDKDQFLQACHYTNLQPLWAEENLQKSNKM